MSKRRDWVDNLLTKAIAGHADGVNIDIEGPVKKGSKQVLLLNELTAEVYSAFKEKLPGSQVNGDTFQQGKYVIVIRLLEVLSKLLHHIGQFIKNRYAHVFNSGQWALA